jgi:bifunctional pyridoxal-dependent enzyme with beta-cystathionase and maltose regulon repressor activities
VAALRRGRYWLDAAVAQIDENAKLLTDLLARYLPGVRYRRPQAIAFLPFLVLHMNQIQLTCVRLWNLFHQLNRAQASRGIGTLIKANIVFLVMLG